MITASTGASWRSSEELLVLHAVRLAGFADPTTVADRVDLTAGIVGDTLRALERRGLVEHMKFADTIGWILTETGTSHDGELLREELEASGARAVLQHTTDSFERSANARLVKVVTDWQLHSAAEREDSRIEVLRKLTELSDELSALMTELVDRLPRFSRYPRQFSAAAAGARAGDSEWIAAVGRLSCHTVWAELHQDLLSSLGRDRSAEPGPAPDADPDER